MKIAGYSKTLSKQLYLPVGSSESQSLEDFRERIRDSLERLYLVDLDEVIGLSPKDIEDIERFLYSRD